MESVDYPVREGEPDCSFYIRKGFCNFGDTFRFNHPPDRNLAISTARMKGEYPERIGYPECPNEVDCAFYMKNGYCKFGSTCKFNHPQPSNMMVSLHGPALYPPIHSGLIEHSAPRHSFIPGSQWQSPSSYSHLIIPPGVLPVPWNTYGQVGSFSSSENQQQTAGNIQNSDMSFQVENANVGFQFGSNSLPVENYAFEIGNVFPERLGQPECQFYMKTGDCKFGGTCKFLHPRGRIPSIDYVLSPIGLPSRTGEPVCIFYSQHGVCKFGPSCKFDHPMRAAPASSTTDRTNFKKVSSSGIVTPSLSPNGIVAEHSDSL